MTLVLRYAARSDRGLVRSNNEDSVYAGARLLALADGMGGHAAGEVASQLVIAALAHLDDDEPGGDLLAKLDTAVQAGNSAIAAQVAMEPDLEGMGTTLTAILFAGNRLGLVHVGDSRGYLFRDGELAQITKDDTFVQTLVEEGRITAEEAHSHPQRSLIMRALTGHDVEPTLTMREVRRGDRYLLCSDGLSDPVSGETIADALKNPDVVATADRLIELALRSGGPDNITVVVADVVDEDIGQTQPILAGAVSGNTGDDNQVTLPNTAAGRASALRTREEIAPRAAPQVQPPKRPLWTRRRIFLVATLATLVLLAGIFIVRAIVRNNYYVAADHGTVAIMRGVQGSLLGYSLHQVHSLGCIDDGNQLTEVGPRAHPDCHLFKVADLRPSERASVQAGLPAGTLDNARDQLRTLASEALLPPCESPATAEPESDEPSPPATETSAPSHAPSATSASPAPDATTPAGPAQDTTTPAAPAPSSTPTADPAPPAQPPGVDCRAAA
ncbi:protein phosphatase 2C domain-containing protein [Mycobacterium sp.]|uniref:PP2C family protein-serine/threonine phosphatase n=1 Tax=Mycobacterium sp. TaxID=1785 RepID=UPI003A855EC6